MEGPRLDIGHRRDGCDGGDPVTNFKGGAFSRQEERGGKDVEDAELNPLRDRFRRIGADLVSQPKQVGVEKEMEVDREGGNDTSSTSTPERDSGPRPEMILVPDSPLPRSHVPSYRVRTCPRAEFGIWRPTFIKRMHRLRLQGRTGPSMMR